MSPNEKDETCEQSEPRLILIVGRARRVGTVTQRCCIDKSMDAHDLMHDVARASRPYPGKECDVIVESNGMSKGLRKALAQCSLGDKDQGTGGMDFFILDGL